MGPLATKALVLLALTYQSNFTPHTPPADVGPAAGLQTTYPYGGSAARTMAGNHEAECYTDGTTGRAPFAVQANAVLDIIAKPATVPNPCGLPVDSGLITTSKEFSQLYGYFEIKAILPAGQGLWPAFWMLPAGDYTAELDIFEQVGVPNTVYSTVHGGDATGNWSNGTVFQPVPLAFDSSRGFHRYGVDWEPDVTTFYIDGRPTVIAPTPATMNRPMYMLANLAVGGTGSWPGLYAADALPGVLRVEYIKAWSTPGTVNAVPLQAAHP